MIETLGKMNIPAHVIESEKAFDLRVWKSVKRFMRSQGIQIVHVHGTRANTNVLWAARSLGLPVLYTIHGWSFHDGLSGWSRRARVLAEKVITGLTSLNICVSESNRQTGIRAFGSFRNAKVIRNGVNLSHFNPEGEYADLRAHYGVPENHILLGYMVRMTYQKDPLNMIRAFAEVAKKRDDITLLMIGDGELRQVAIQLAGELGLTGRIRFDGFRLDVPAVLNAVDVYCLPSLWEGFPIGVLEAMAMGKP